MRVASLLAVALAATVAAGCTGDPQPGDPAGTPVPPATSAPGDVATDVTPTASPTPTDTDVAFGTGTVQVDGTEVPVSGDCDVSRAFGTQPVDVLDEDVDVVLAVDNVAGDGAHAGPFPLQVRLQGRGAVAERRITSQGAAEAAEATYAGDVAVAELRDRRALEFLDVATLHVEATQERVRGESGPATRELVLDVTCSISRPG